MEFKTLVEAVGYYAKTTPGKPCLIEAESGRRLTYGEFWRLSLAFAERLHKAGLQRGERVVVRVGQVIETFVVQYGVYLAGGVYCPVERNMKETYVQDMMAYFQSDFLVSTKPVGNTKWIDLKTAAQYADPPANPDEPVLPKAEDLCAIIFTTGTTGKARGVMLSFKSILIFASVRQTAYGVTDQDVFLWVQPLDRVGGIRAFSSLFLSGGTAVYYNGIIFIKEFFEIIHQYKVTSMYLQSFAISILLGNDAEAFRPCADQLKAVIIGGGFVSEFNKAQLRDLLPKTRLFIQYGATEISPIAFFEFSQWPQKINCVGKPFECVTVNLVNEERKPIGNTSIDHLGIMECKGDAVMLGYWNAPELTEKVMQNGTILLTDMGYFDRDGFLYIMGRRDDVIVSGGFKIAPYEIENAAAQIPGIIECVCVPVPDAILGSVPRLFVKMDKSFEFSAKKILEYLSERLETYKLPRSIREIEIFPRVGKSQKINREELKKYD